VLVQSTLVLVRISRWIAVGAVGTALLVAAGPARAAGTATPTALDDPSATGTGQCASAASGGECSLREAINFVGAGGTVRLRPPPAGATDTYTLTQGALTLSDPVTIAGADARHTVLTAGGASPDVVATTTGAVTISGLTITGGGATDQGAGIANTAAKLTLDRVQVTANRATGASLSPARGGGIYNAASLTLSHSTVWSNTVAAGASPFAYGGGVYNGGTLNVVDSTIAGNAANGGTVTASGGGIAALSPTGPTTLSSVTLSANSATGSTALGGNLWVSGATASLRDTIVAGGTGSPGAENCATTGLGARVSSLGYNLEDRAQCGLTTAGDQPRSDPQLGPLQNNGGPTDTQAPPASSPAVDQGNPGDCSDANGAPVPDDQRGQPRLSPCDVGAFEGSYPPSFAGPPALSGRAAVGEALACTASAVAGAPSTLTYRWLRDTAPIPAATESDYLVSDADAGHRLRCEATAANHDGSATRTSRGLGIPADFTGVTALDAALHLRTAHVRLRLACAAAAIARCHGTLALLVRWAPRRAHSTRSKPRPRTLTVGHAGFQIASAQTAVLFVRIPGPGQRMVIDNRGRGLHARLVTTAWDDTGRRAQVTRVVVITTSRRKPRVARAHRRKRHSHRKTRPPRAPVAHRK
jgi:hypothetical protein